MASTLTGPYDIPTPADVAKLQAAGSCIVNVDGGCINGGIRVGGASGYNIAGMGGPSTCSAFPLFFAQRIPYTSSAQGYQASTNANTLRAETQSW